MTLPKGFVLHFDGKLLPPIAGKGKSEKSERYERLPIIVSCNGSEQLLAVPKLDSGCADDIADGIVFSLLNWNLHEQVEAICCDTTITNTGVNNGACVLLEEHLEKDLLYLMCRHHIYELCLRAVFDLKMPEPTICPTVPIFDRFATAWPNLDKKKIKSGMADKQIAKFISADERTEIINFCKNHLMKQQCRDDYKEFLQLTLIFLDAPEAQNIVIRTPGPTSHARWMGKAIYSLKMFLFRHQFDLSKEETKSLRSICLFLIRLYVQAWFGCTSGVDAPNQDLNFIKNTVAYAKTDDAISHEVTLKFSNHLWYLSEESVAFAFFDQNVPNEMKRKMVERLEYGTPSRGCKRVICQPANIREKFISKDLCDFVTVNTKTFFNRFGINTDFLGFDPSTWSERVDYKGAVQICHNIHVVNDAAERGVKLMTEFNQILTNDEEQKQYLLLIVADYRKRFPSHNKKRLRTDDNNNNNM